MLNYQITVDDGRFVALDPEAVHPNMEAAVEVTIQAAIAMVAEAISPANDNQAVWCEVSESGTEKRRAFQVAISVVPRN